jgi:ATP-dependent Clp protease ATP-binding subunit ClpX
MEECAIEYKKYKLADNIYMLVPVKLVEGIYDEGLFFTKKGSPIKVCDSPESLELGKVLADDIMDDEDLSYYYDCDEEANFLKEYYLSERMDFIRFVCIKDGQIYKKDIRVNDLKEKHESEIYEMLDDEPSLVLSDKIVNKLLNINNLKSMKKELNLLKNKINKYKNTQEKNISKLVVKDGHISRIETRGKCYINVDDPKYKELDQCGFIYQFYSPDDELVGETIVQKNDVAEKNKNDIQEDHDISVSGLFNYLKERVIGHERELKIIATRMIRNTKAVEGEKTKSILVPGPTGTGKTLTFEVAANYLGLPHVTVNTADLVPDGIVGTSIQDNLMSLLNMANGDVAKAKRGIVVFDEFDKLAVSNLDLKQSVKPIFLKVLEGSDIILQESSGHAYSPRTFNTSLLNIALLGAFSECFQEEKTLGFKTQPKSSKLFSKDKMYDLGYYDRELITRIPIVIPYYELTPQQMRETLYCKSSELLKEITALKRDFNIEVEGYDEYVEGVMDILSKKDKSMRDVNNIVINSFIDIEYELEDQPNKFKTLKLTRETPKDSTKFDLK